MHEWHELTHSIHCQYESGADKMSETLTPDLVHSLFVFGAFGGASLASEACVSHP